jgi:hypothetical protein
VRRDLLLELGKRNRVQPLDEPVDRQVGDFSDGAPIDADLQRFRLELRAVALGALACGLVLSQEDADVLLVPFLLEVLEKRENPLVAARARAKQCITLGARETSIGMPSRFANSASARRLPS